MKLDSELCHIDSTKIIVRISATNNRESLGSALGEGRTVREAETAALNELITRIKTYQVEQIKTKEIQSTPKLKEQAQSIKAKQKEVSMGIEDINIDVSNNKSESAAESEVENKIDWSDEIAEVDSELKRIGWSREEEKVIIKKTIGYTSRNRITNLKELILFRDILRLINKNEKIENLDNIFNRDILTNNSTKKLNILGWDNQKSVNFLKQYFNEISRSKLNLKELIRFNLLLDKHP